ncbi:hypothetical protein [Azonexus sp.]|jgi:predicted ATP-grasp superfamily ATP-dependent carboligase|uniref:carboxylate--amine ligase n=1 Tax=Azonexus sp. TaxID=1872668 RepID=UPI00283490D3|nr:hypothetical protein [Azonexus sp.]MDR1996233.1 hypothetical protein [Azonexus sp.]
MNNQKNIPYAVVVGLCGHGLGLVRSLYRNGVPVIALEADDKLPGVQTRCAKVKMVPDINHEGLIDALIALAHELKPAPKPVLFLTSDRMVETIGAAVHRIVPYYRLSWADAAARLLPFLGKDQLEQRCRETGIQYPRSILVKDFSRIHEVLSELQFPLIAKPTRPISAFKTLVASSLSDFIAAQDRINASLPIIVQEFIPGDDRSIRFGALYLKNGRILARFEGRKLRSRPMGHTTVAIAERNDSIHNLTSRFFAGLDLSGPVSLELKEKPDEHNSQWVIEPTVGRTDFWADLCIADGVNLPMIEYLSQTEQPLPKIDQRNRFIWINGERDPAGLLWLLTHYPHYLIGRRIRGLYASISDPKPFIFAFVRYIASLPPRIISRAKKLMW